MDRHQFSSVLDRYSHLESNEVEELFQFRKQWPYCQIFPIVLARFAKDHHGVNQQRALQVAAVWTTDRGLLRELMVAEDRHDEAVVTEAIRRVDLADEIIKDLKRLRQLKDKFEQLYGDMPRPVEAGSTGKKRTSTRSKPAGTTARKKGARKDEDTIITEIKSRKKLKPASEKQKAQMEVIDEFIKAKPKIKPPAKTPEEVKAEQENPMDFNDAVVSETLVDILIRQDKKEKAIDVLKKLIWKFPQKKAYFAAKIEELRK